MQATCIACGRTYWVTEDYMKIVQAGGKESLCIPCDPEYKEVGDEEKDD